MASSPKMPAPPDPYDTAKAQGQFNTSAAINQSRLNMVDQVGPYGSLTYSEIPNSGVSEKVLDEAAWTKAWDDYKAGGQQGPAPQAADFQDDVFTTSPRFTATTTLSPEQQAIADRENQLKQGMLSSGVDQLGRIDQALAQPFDLSGMPAAAQVRGREDFAGERQRIEDALMQRLNPYLEQARTREQTRLANQGFVGPQNEGYAKAMDTVNRQENDARLAAIAAAGQEQSRIFGIDQAQAAQQNALRERAIQEAMLKRQTPINEIAALMSGNQTQLPQFVSTPQTGIQPANYQGAASTAYQGQLANFQNQQSRQNSMMGGLFGLGGTVLGGGIGLL